VRKPCQSKKHLSRGVSRALTPYARNPTARQRVDRSSPFYHLTLPGNSANPTARQRVDFFKSFLQHRTNPVMRANPTARQRVDRSSPFYHLTLPGIAESHSAAACGFFQVLSTIGAPTPYARESHSAAACGSFKSFLLRAVYSVRRASRAKRFGALFIERT